MKVLHLNFNFVVPNYDMAHWQVVQQDRRKLVMKLWETILIPPHSQNRDMVSQKILVLEVVCWGLLFDWCCMTERNMYKRCRLKKSGLLQLFRLLNYLVLFSLGGFCFYLERKGIWSTDNHFTSGFALIMRMCN